MVKLKKYLRLLITRLSQPIFLLFLFISFGMWYLSKLSHVYSTTVTIPVHIENSYSSNVMLLEHSYDVVCRVEGDGYKLLLQNLFPRRHAITVTSAQLRFESGGNNKYVKHVLISSLFDAMSSQLTDLKLLSIKTNEIDVTTSEVVSKRVPVINDILVRTEIQYKQIGKTRLTPDSITVRGLIPILDTISAVHTDREILSNLNQDTHGIIGLRPMVGVTYSTRDVTYDIEIDGFTEIEFELPVVMIGCPPNLSSVIMPKKVRIKLNVNRANYNAIKKYNITLFTKFSDKSNAMENKFKVYHNKLPLGVTEIGIFPAYVDVVFDQVDEKSTQ